MVELRDVRMHSPFARATQALISKTATTKPASVVRLRPDEPMYILQARGSGRGDAGLSHPRLHPCRSLSSCSVRTACR